MTIKIYGPVASRTARSLWMAHELGVPFEHVAIEMKDVRQSGFAELNPNNKVPVMVDGDLTLFESMAINLYLAKKYNKDGLWPSSAEDQARVYQWSFWGMMELEKPLLTILIDTFVTPVDNRNPVAVADAKKSLLKPFGILDGALGGRDYLLGSTFTAADLNVASVCTWARLIKLDFATCPRVDAWLQRCLSRPAYKAARGGK